MQKALTPFVWGYFHRCLLSLFLGLGVFAGNFASAQLTFTKLHDFVYTNGATPTAALLLSSNVLYGTLSRYGLNNGDGSVFRMNLDGSSFTNLHIFTQGADGGNPCGGLVLVSNKLYGSALFGGTSNTGCIFGINPDGTGLTNIFNFPPITGDPSSNLSGAYPQAGLVASGSTLYGAAYEAGVYGWGTLFSLTTNGSSFTNFLNFNYTNGQYPVTAMTLSGSLLYGVVSDGTPNHNGTLFKVGTNGVGYTNFYNFDGAVGYPYTNYSGANPVGVLVVSGGTLYGTASDGGSNTCGTIFKINTDGSGFTLLHTFSAMTGPFLTNSDGGNPGAGLLLFSNTLYGTAMNGGLYGNGTLFSLSTDGSAFSTLYSFTSTNTPAGTNVDGAHPVGGLIIAGNALYGTASYGGVADYGTAFSLTFPPPLFIAGSGTNVIVSWPTNFTGYNLQSTTNLSLTVTWTTVAGQNLVTNPATGGKKFYRLMSP